MSDAGSIGMFLADALILAMILVVLIRFGLLALVSLMFFYMRLYDFPITLDTSAWYAGTPTLTLLALAAIVLYAFRTATAGRHVSPSQRGS